MNYIELFINDPATAKLDLAQEFDIALQYSIADIKDITKRNAAFSKTIILPGTKNNNYWMGNLYDINTDFTMFNPNRKTSCTLSVNTEVVMKGYLQLRKIKKLNNVDHQGNQIYYEIVIFNNVVDLMTELGEKTLNGLNLDELRHDYTFNNIIYSWTQSYTNGWVYPMYGTQDKDPFYNVTDFYPSFYSRYLIDKIFQQAGFGWTGSLRTNSQFAREIIPFVGSGSQSISQNLIDEKNLRVGITQSYTQSQTFNTTSSGPLSYYSAAGGSVAGVNYFSATYSLNDKTFQSALNPALSFYDNANTFNTTTSVWTTDRNRKWAPQWQLNYNLQLFNPNSDTIRIRSVFYNSSAVNIAQPQNFIDNPLFDIFHTLEYKLPASTIWQVWDTVLIRKGGFVKNSTGGYLPNTGVSQNINFSKQASDLFLPTGTQIKIKVEVKVCTGGGPAPFNINQHLFYSYKSDGSQYGVVQNQFRKFELRLSPQVSPQNYLYSNGVSFAAQELDPIEPKDWISSKIKQKDFINDLIKRYNLYMQVDPNNERLIILDTRPDFYKRINNVDWTFKKDFSSEDEITLLAELQFKQALFTMKADTSDKYNSDYTNLVGDVYGQYKYTYNNDFVKGEQKIESPFSPTPLIKTAFGAVVPAISQEDPKVSPRVLYWGGLITPPPSNNVGFQWQLKGQTNVANFTSYPYAGHFDHPLNPTLDIHFGTPKYMYYYDYGVLPYNTMYETYWSDWVESIEDGKMVKSKFYLDEFDVRTIKDNFWTKVFILDSYYYVNKIIDYKPLTNGLTTVELLKIKTIKREIQPGKTSSIARPIRLIRDNFTLPNFGNGNSGVSGGTIVVGNNNQGGGITINGSFSVPNKGIVVGNNNTLKSSSGAIIGDDNSVNGKNVMVIGGSNNSIQGENVITIGRNESDINDISSAYVGREIKADLDNKQGTYPQFNSGVNIAVEGYNLGQSDWRVIPENKEVKLQSGKQLELRDITILGHFDIESQIGTYSFGGDVKWIRGQAEINEQVNVRGLLTVGGELWIGNPPIVPTINGLTEKHYGVFYSTINQSIATASVSQIVELDTSGITNGISLSGNKIILSKVSQYQMTTTILLHNLSAQPHDITFWLKFNGQPYPLSAHHNTLPARKSAGIPSETVLNFTFIGENQNIGDYVEIWCNCDSTSVSFAFTPGSSDIPDSPSVSVNIAQL